MKNISLLLLASIFFVCKMGEVGAVIVGSNTTVARQNMTTFPQADSNNTMLGFSVFENGFILASSTTTCTFNALFPVAGPIRLAGGTLYLNKDLRCSNVTRLVSVGNVWGNLYAFELAPTATTFHLPEATTTSILKFNHTNLVMNSNVQLNAPLHMRGGCKITGNGYRLTLGAAGSISVRNGSTLLLDDVELFGVGSTNVSCLTNNATLTLKNSILRLSQSWSFTRGSLLFLSNVAFTGTVQFNYTTPLTSTIASKAVWYLSPGMTFSYAPARPRKDLLFMNDASSILYLNGASLFSTMTGIKLSTGTLMVDNKVTFSTQARNMGEAPILTNDLTINLLSGAVLDVYGTVRYS